MDRNELLSRVPPHNIEAEKAILSAMVLDKEALIKVIEELSAEELYLESHQKIFNSIIYLYNSNIPVDLITLHDELASKQLIDKIGGASYLSEMVKIIASTANIEYYIQIVREKSELRKLIRSCMETINDAYDTDNNVSDIIDKAEARIFEIANKKIKTGLMSIKSSVNETVDFMEKTLHNKGQLTGQETGYIDLDQLTGGFQNSDFIIIAARPSVGKTSLILNMAENMGIGKKKTVAIFSLEMSRIQLCQRFICSFAKIKSNSVRTGGIAMEDFNKITSVATSLNQSNIFIDDSSQITVLEMKAKARRLKAKHGLNAIFIDYLQLISSPNSKKYENRQTEIANISRGLKQFAREIEVPIIAAAQLNRSVESRTDKKPFLSDLRDSGAIEQDADVIIFLHRDDYYEKDNEEKKGKAELIIAKQRNGPTGEVQLRFINEYTRFENSMSESDEKRYNNN